MSEDRPCFWVASCVLGTHLWGVCRHLLYLDSTVQETERKRYSSAATCSRFWFSVIHSGQHSVLQSSNHGGPHSAPSPVIPISLLTHSGPTLTKTPSIFIRTRVFSPPVVFFFFLSYACYFFSSSLDSSELIIEMAGGWETRAFKSNHWLWGSTRISLMTRQWGVARHAYFTLQRHWHELCLLPPLWKEPLVLMR